MNESEMYILQYIECFYFWCFDYISILIHMYVYFNKILNPYNKSILLQLLTT